MAIRCKCGCDCYAKWIVAGFDYDPKKPHGMGRKFKEPCCDNAAEYLIENSFELQLPCERMPIED